MKAIGLHGSFLYFMLGSSEINGISRRLPFVITAKAVGAGFKPAPTSGFRLA
jgi:hypothetical protein